MGLGIRHDIGIHIEDLEEKMTEQDIAAVVQKYTALFERETALKEAAKDLESSFIASRENTIPAEGGVTGTATTPTSNTTPSVPAGASGLPTKRDGAVASGVTSSIDGKATGGRIPATNQSATQSTPAITDGSNAGTTNNEVLPGNVGTTSQVYGGVTGQQTVRVPKNFQGTTTSKPTLEQVKAHVQEQLRDEQDDSKKRYWGEILKKLSDGISMEEILKDDRTKGNPYTFLSDWYTDNTSDSESNVCLDWTDIKSDIIAQLKKLEATDPDFKKYYTWMISEVENATDISRLFEEHDELFILLKSVIPGGLPGSIKIMDKQEIYPNLSAKKLYANVGVEMIYYVWSGSMLDEVVVTSTSYRYGEIVTTKDNRTPPREPGQWYDYDRIKNARKVDSSFWEAAIYNTENGFAHLYATIAQRNAYYKFADTYLNSKGILSEWYDAAVRVTMNSPILGEVAVGAAGKNSLNLWFLYDETEEFLRDGNKFLFPQNMNNVKLLLEGKGKINMTFTDANGVEQSFVGLTQKDLDFKLVEFEQSLVGEYLIEYLDNNRREGFIRDWNEFTNNTVEQDLEDIIKQINKNFDSFMAEDLTQDIIKEHFTKNGRIVFDFSKYEDRVKLGQIMVEELYYKRSRDTFKKENFDKILASPNTYKNAIISHEELTYDKALIPARNPLKLKEYYLELLEDYKRLQEIFKDDERLAQVMKEIGHILEDIGKALAQELLSMYQETEEYIIDKIQEYKEKLSYIIEHPIDYLSDEIVDQVYSNGILITDPLRFIKEYFSGDPVIIKRRDIRDGRWKRRPQKEKGKQGRMAEKRDKVAASALTNTAIRIYPEVKILGDKEREAILKSSDYKKTVAILLFEFSTGKGKSIYNFDYGVHDFANKILTDRIQKEILDKTLELLERINYDFVTIPDSIVLQPALPFSPSPGIFIESIYKHLNSNLAQLFIGGAIVRVQIKNGNIVGYIQNDTSKTSLMIHMNVENLKREDGQKKQKRLSTIRQRIHFSFKLPSKYDA